jgi:Nucleotide modification associated domain 3
MKIVLIRVGVDSAAGGLDGPLFSDGSFEYIPIPDGWHVDTRTYGTIVGRHGVPLSTYFPASRQHVAEGMSVHVDPEFQTFTYGDPTRLKARLRFLEAGDMVVFYAGLKGWGSPEPTGLYLIGYFVVMVAGMADSFDDIERQELFAENFHVRHPSVFASQRSHLVLVKGGPGSRLLEKAVLISEIGRDRSDKPLKVLSTSMRSIFGNFGGKVSIQRSSPRWVFPEYVERATEFVLGLPHG